MRTLNHPRVIELASTDAVGTIITDRPPHRSVRALLRSGRTMARSGLRMMPTFPSSSLKFRTAGFPRYGFKAGISDKAFPFGVVLTSIGWPLSFVLPASLVGIPVLCREDAARWSTSVRAASAALPQGPSLRSGLCCPGPSTLNRPHPPHSQAHPDFTA